MSASGNTNSSANTANSLGPFDLSGLGMGFGIYRPRRASYTFATQEYRHRSESYRCATRKDQMDSTTSDHSVTEDFIDDVVNHRRKTSYIKATKNPSSKLPSCENNRQSQLKYEEHNVNLSPGTEYETKFYGNANQTENRLKATERTNSEHEDAEPEIEIRCNNRKPSSKNSRDQSKFDAVGNKNNSSEDISLTEVTLIQTVPRNESNYNRPLRSDYNRTNGDLNDEHTAMNQNSTVAFKSNHNRKSAWGFGTGNIRKSVSSTLRFNKNLIVLSISFILIYSSFQAIQNLQSSINASLSLGPITMMLVHVATVLSCLIAPTLINILSAKWALCIGVLLFLTWFGANFQPSFYSLVPTSMFVGLAQGVVWSAESSYIHKLAFDWSKISRASVDDEIFRFHGIFLACFQTTHIWGNLISSLWLSQRERDLTEGNFYPPMYDTTVTGNGSVNMEGMGDGQEMALAAEETYLPLSKCGALFQCEGPSPRLYPTLPTESPFSGVLWKLMIFYVLFGVIAFLLVIFLLDRIGARASPGKSPKEIITQHTSQLITHPTLRLLIPLLLFNGMQQGFMYQDYNHYFVTCSLGVHYVGYCMITLGVANVFGAVFVTLFAHRIPREVILGFGGILHIALMIGYLIWIPEDKPVLFCILAGAWGLCDAIWQTQCNTLICLTCIEEPDVAFTNYRLVQSIGLALVFGIGTWVCVSVKLYILITLLVLAIMFYVLAEYQLRHSDDEVFEP